MHAHSKSRPSNSGSARATSFLKQGDTHRQKRLDVIVDPVQPLQLDGRPCEYSQTFMFYLPNPCGICCPLLVFTSRLTWVLTFLYDINVRLKSRDVLKLLTKLTIGVPGRNLHAASVHDMLKVQNYFDGEIVTGSANWLRPFSIALKVIRVTKTA